MEGKKKGETHAPYKKGEGKVTRRIAFYSILVLVVWGFKEFGKWLTGFKWAHTLLVGKEDEAFLLPYYDMPLRIGVVIALVLTVVAAIVIYRVLNRPRLADLLIETETELKKVSWPNWEDTRQSTVVVVTFVLLITGYLLIVELALERIFFNLILG